MERATEPHLVEEAERILKEYRDKLSYESISLFNEDGTLLYTTDATITPQKITKLLFEYLDAIVYAFVIGVPRIVAVHDANRCLIIKPLYVSDYGVVDAWLFALGDCRTLSCAWISEELVKQCKNNMKKDISTTLENERFKSILRRSFDFPKILGHEFDLEGGATLILDGDDGIVALTLGDLPWGIETSGGRKYPDVIVGLEELDEKIQTKSSIGAFIPPMIKRVKVQVAKADYSRSNRLLLFILMYSIILVLPDLRLAPTFLVADILLAFILLYSRRDESVCSGVVCSCSSIIAGILFLLFIIYSFVDQIELGLTWYFLGPYSIMIGIAFILNILGKEKYDYRYPNQTNDSRHSEFNS